MARKPRNPWVLVSKFAERAGVSSKTMLRRLRALARREAPNGDVPWLQPQPGKAWLRVNVSLLRKAHPHIFEVTAPVDIEDRVERLRQRTERMERRVSAEGARLRKVEQRQRGDEPAGARELQALRDRVNATEAAMGELATALDEATRETLETIKAIDAKRSKESRPVTKRHAKRTKPDNTSREEGK